MANPTGPADPLKSAPPVRVGSVATKSRPAVTCTPTFAPTEYSSVGNMLGCIGTTERTKAVLPRPSVTKDAEALKTQ